ncbi:sensor histidine kinase [Alteromonas sp. H39]|uniref:sensor histidine kinase n=1 Tax=Alteromonas sp. H39 TaxID=3389876 RepID=UPI0039DF6807
MRETITPVLLRASTWWMLLVAFFLAASTGYTLYLVRLDGALQKLAGEHNGVLGRASSLFSAEMGDVRLSTTLLDTHLQDLITERADSSTIIDALMRIGKGHPAISQIRWLSVEGMEMYRINFDGSNAVSVPPSGLQDKSQRQYYQQATALRPGELMVSSIDLNVESGQVQTPYEPTIRGILRAHSNHPLGDGFFVVNIALTTLFSQLKTLSTNHVHLLIASNDDRWLLHTEPAKEWTIDRSSTPHSLKIDTPQLYLALNEQSAVALFRNSRDDIYSGHKFRLNTGSTKQSATLYFLAETQSNIISRLHREALLPAIGLALMVLLISGLIFYRDWRNTFALEVLSKQLKKDKNELATSLEREKLLQDELVEAEKMASLGILVAGVSHELSTPIGGAVMSVSSIQQRTQEFVKKASNGLSKKQLDDYLKHCADSAQLALENLNRSGDLIKRFKRLAVDRGNEESASFDLALTIDDLVRSLSPLLKRQEATLDVSVPANITMLSFPGILSQVLQNLITNCIDHANVDGRRLHIHLKASVQGEQVTITIRDNGGGISDLVRHRLFDPFITTARNKGNTGLGLHLVHQWVNRVLEGQISFDSSPEGTLFILCIPQDIGVT